MFKNNLTISLLLLLLLATPALASSSKLTKNITVMTLNLANYDDHLRWLERLQLIADEIQKSHADVVVLQEVRFNPDHESNKDNYQNMAEQILLELNKRDDFLNAELVTQPVMYYPHPITGKLGKHYYPLPAKLAPDNKSYYWEGLSIISKPHIIEAGNYFLSQTKGCKDDNRRVTQYIKIKNGIKPLYIANIHFSGGNDCIKDNAKETLSFLQSYIQSAPVLIMGDFNAKPDDPIFTPFKKLGLVDVWQKLRPHENGFTCSTPNSQVMDQRIDLIWANAKVANQFSTTKQIWMIANKPKSGLYPSDHYGLAITFKV